MRGSLRFRKRSIRLSTPLQPEQSLTALCHAARWASMGGLLLDAAIFFGKFEHLLLPKRTLAFRDAGQLAQHLVVVDIWWLHLGADPLLRGGTKISFVANQKLLPRAARHPLPPARWRTPNN